MGKEFFYPLTHNSKNQAQNNVYQETQVLVGAFNGILCSNERLKSIHVESHGEVFWGRERWSNRVVWPVLAYKKHTCTRYVSVFINVLYQLLPHSLHGDGREAIFFIQLTVRQFHIYIVQWLNIFISSPLFKVALRFKNRPVLNI